MDVGLVVLALSTRPDDSDDVALVDDRALAEADFAEMHQRDGVPVRGRERHDLPARANGAGERDRAVGGGEHVGAGQAGDVDATVLTWRVRVVTHREAFEDLAGCRP